MTIHIGEWLLTLNLRKDDTRDRHVAIKGGFYPKLHGTPANSYHQAIQIDDVLNSLSAMKSENQVIIPLNGKSSIVDHMIVVNGTSDTHVKAIANRLVKDLKDFGYGQFTPELGQNDAWVLIDLGEIIVHIFKKETRELYALEKMWSFSGTSNSENVLTL